MSPLKQGSNYWKKPVRRLRLPKIEPLKSKGLFEEYLYFFLAMIFVLVSILGKAGGLSTYNAIVVGLWVTGAAWFGEQLKRYYQDRANPEPGKKSTQPFKTPPQAVKDSLAQRLKEIIGPLLAPKPAAKPFPVGQKKAEPGNKPAFVYKRPTLERRDRGVPANWPKPKDKKPKR